MNIQRKTGEGPWSSIEKDDPREFLTLEQACKRFSVHLEAFSTEPGCEFEEHVVIKAGLMQLNDCVDMQELDIPYWRDDEGYTREQFNEEFACDIDAYTFENSDEYLKIGGYDDWGDCKEIEGIVQTIKNSYEKDSKAVAKDVKAEAKDISSSQVSKINKDIEQGR